MGILKVTGTLSLDQFWPQGGSDADTTKVYVNVVHNSFEYQPREGEPFRPTPVFFGATVKGKATKPPIDAKSRITVRLQGIDAPELHYRPTPLGRNKATTAQRGKFKTLNKEYRQHFGESATVALRQHLSRAGQDTIDCVVSTQVQTPTEVFDTYARFVGDLWVEQASEAVHINRWLVEEGWAFPAFYNSMQNEEIQTLLDAAQQGKKQRRRIWRLLRNTITEFDFSLVYRGKDVDIDEVADRGPIIMPKLFRRLCTFSTYRKAGIEKGRFLPYLSRSPDYCYETADFLENGIFAAVPYRLADFVSPPAIFERQPHQLVFKEQASRLVSAQGKEILQWF